LVRCNLFLKGVYPDPKGVYPDLKETSTDPKGFYPDFPSTDPKGVYPDPKGVYPDPDPECLKKESWTFAYFYRFFDDPRDPYFVEHNEL